MWLSWNRALPGRKSRQHFSNPCVHSAVGPPQCRPRHQKPGTRVPAKLFNPQLVGSHGARGDPYNVECFSKGTDSSRAAASSRNQQRAPVRGCTMAAGSAPSLSSRMRCVRDQDPPQTLGRAGRGSHWASVRAGDGVPTGSCFALHLTHRGLRCTPVWSRVFLVFIRRWGLF